MKALYLDCFSGISGDMLVGAFCDLGVKPSALEWELSKVEIGDFHMHFERAQRQKIEGVHFSIHEGATHQEAAHGHSHEHGHSHGHEHGHGDHDHEHGHAHDHDHAEHDHDHGEPHDHEHGAHAHGGKHHASSAELPQANDRDHGTEVEHAHARHEEEHAHSHTHGHEHSHTHTHDDCCGHGHHHHDDHEHEHVHGRTHAEIRALIQKSDLSDFVKKHALGIFLRIAEAEGKIHGMSVDDVHFHEVGALDSIADIICACVAMETLGFDKVHASPLHEGRGWIDCAHGRFPLPAPATLEILKGIAIGETDETHELITPTGAAFLAEFAAGTGPMPRMKVEKIGYGVGTRDLASRPNVLRAVIGELVTA